MPSPTLRARPPRQFSLAALGLAALLASDVPGQLTATAQVDAELPPADLLVETELYPAGIASGDALGSSSAVQGDVLVVGARFSDVVADDGGAAYVYRRGARGWVFDDVLAPPDLGAGDLYGYSCSLDGDVLVVSAPLHGELGTQVGSVYVYRDVAGAFVLEQELLPSNPLPFGRFGTDIAVSGDVIAVGRYRPAAGNVGTVHVYRFDGASWVEEDTVTGADAVVGDFYAYSLDVDGDRLAVGSYEDDGVGSIYFYRHDAGDWAFSQKVFAPVPQAGSLFSKGLSMSGDVLVAGANRHDALGFDAGAAYVLRDTGAEWVHEQTLFASDGETMDRFGTHVGVSGNVIVSGSRLDDTALGVDTGSAYVFRRVDGAWVEWAFLVGGDLAADDWYGHTVATDGRTVLVHAPQHGHGPSEAFAGASYAYELALEPVGAPATSVPPPAVTTPPLSTR